MSSQDERLSSDADRSRQGFNELYIFLRDAFQERGLVSIPPKVLQLFKQYPLQGIECPDITAFAKLFQGARSDNRFRLEANSFVYTVQILFHLRPNLVQERVLHLLMVLVRLLKDEKGASQRLSELAGKEIDHYVVAKKRVTISNKLVPWLLKHFSQDSTSARLKIVAAQFLFHLLQGDAEAKNILSSAPKRDRWSLGEAISASADLPLRIWAANILREISLANIDIGLFWSPESLDNNDVQLLSSFLADARWLNTSLLHLREIDNRRAVPDESRAKIHEILSLKIGSLSFSDAASKALATVSEGLLFMIPAHQNRPLQILEVSLVANMEIHRSDGLVANDGAGGERTELQLQLRNTGFYILNGFKSAIDQVQLSFATNHECDGLCQAIAHALPNLPPTPIMPKVGLSNVGLSNVDRDGTKSRPKKQSHAVMIDLSQDVVVSDDTQLLSHPLQTPRRSSTSRHIDESRFSESSISPVSPLREITEDKAASVQEKCEKDPLHDAQSVQHKLHSHAEIERNHNVERVLPPKETPEDLVAPAHQESTNQESDSAQKTWLHLPQQLHNRDSVETNITTSVSTSNLQHLTLNALRNSIDIPTTATPRHTDSIAPPRRGGHRFAAAHASEHAAPPQSTLANSAKRMGPKPDSIKHAAVTAMINAQKPNEDNKNKTSRTPQQHSRAGEAASEGDDAVDWDEDLRVDQDEHKEQSKLAKRTQNMTSRASDRTGPKKSANTTTTPKASGPKKKGPAKNKTKEVKSQAAPVNAGLAATRPRRAAAKVSYKDQLEQNEQSQETARESTAIVDHIETDETSAVAPSPSMKDDHKTHKKLSVDKNSRDDAIDSTFAKPQSPFAPAQAVVEVPGSGEARLVQVELRPEPERMHVENDPSGANRLSSPGKIGGQTSFDRGISDNTDNPEVEVAEDSHPMAKDQRKDATSGPTKSFGSALTDLMKNSGMRPIAMPYAVGVREKPFGDKNAFVDSVLSALKQSMSKPDMVDTKSDMMKRVQTPCRKQEPESASKQGPPNETQLPPRTRRKIALEASQSHEGLEEADEENQLYQAAYAATPSAAFEQSKVFHESTSLPQQQRSDTDRIHPKRGNDGLLGKNVNASSSSLPHPNEKPKLLTKTDILALVLPLNDRGANTHNDRRKRGSPSEAEKVRRVKRARRTDPGPEKSRIGDDQMQSPSLQSQSTVNLLGHGPEARPRISEPSARVVEEVVPGGGVSALPWMQKTQKPAQLGNGESGHPRIKSSAPAGKPVQSKMQTPQSHRRLDDPPRLTDDHHHRKGQMIGFSANGPRNQDISSSSKRGFGVGQSSSVATETSKHLAFKTLHSVAKAVKHPENAARNPLRLFGVDKKRVVQMAFCDRESTDDGIQVDEESANELSSVPAIANVEDGRSASQTSKVDENGSPRLHLQNITSRLSHLPEKSGVVKDSGHFDEGAGMISDPESAGSEGLETDESAYFGLETVVSKYTTANAPMNAKSQNVRSRPSIGLGNLLDHSFPQASKSIRTNAFRAPVVADEAGATKSSQKSKDAKPLDSDRSFGPTVVPRGSEGDTRPVDDKETPAFDIDQLNVSEADEPLTSAASCRVRRLRSRTPQLPGGGILEQMGSPPSFNTRLGKMIMPPPPRKEAHMGEPATEYDARMNKGREQSVAIDAEMTLVNGEALEDESDVSSPDRHQRSSSSSSSSSDGKNAPVSASHRVPVQDLPSDHALWNEKVAETQQTVREILNQVSQKLLFRFTNAEEGIKIKLDHYHYGGWKIVNNFVDQFDTRVTREKEMPSPQMIEHQTRLHATVARLKQARKDICVGPSLEGLEKSREKRVDYVLLNLRKFAAAAQDTQQARKEQE